MSVCPTNSVLCFYVCCHLFILVVNSGGRGHWVVYYTGLQSFIKLFLFIFSTILGTFIEFWFDGSFVDCPNVSTTNCNIHTGYYCVWSFGMYVNFTAIVLSIYSKLWCWGFETQQIGSHYYLYCRYWCPVSHHEFYHSQQHHQPGNLFIIFDAKTTKELLFSFQGVRNAHLNPRPWLNT